MARLGGITQIACRKSDGMLINTEKTTEVYSSGKRINAGEECLESSEGDGMEATSNGWSGGRNVIGHVPKFGLLIQWVRIPPGQSVDPQAGSEPCSATGNCCVDA
jgi:hypothetical protein